MASNDLAQFKFTLQSRPQIRKSFCELAVEKVARHTESLVPKQVAKVLLDQNEAVVRLRSLHRDKLSEILANYSVETSKHAIDALSLNLLEVKNFE